MAAMFSSLFILIIGLLTMTRPLESARNAPRLLTEPASFVGQAGESVTLPCEIVNPGRRSVFWFKGGRQEGRELIMQMKSVRGRFMVPRHFQEAVRSGKLNVDRSNLIINDLTVHDTDSYTCSLAAVAGQTVTHTLEVRGGRASPSRSSLVLQPSPREGHVSVGKGYPVTFSCEVPGSGAIVSWQKVGSRDVLSVGSVLNIYSAQMSDSGSYVCTAEDGVSAPASFTFELIVEYVEVRVREQEVVASTEDFSALLTCEVDGYPEPSLTWYDSQGPIRSNDPRRRVSSRGKTHYLQLTQMTPADLGEYQCYGYNEKGRDRQTIMVKADPGSARVLGAEATGYGFTYRVTWEVDSLAPVNYYYLAYRDTNSDTVMSQSVPGGVEPVSGSSTLYRASTEVDLTPGVTYEIMVTAVAEGNRPGPGQREPFFFTVPMDVMELTATRKDNWKWWKTGLTFMSRLPQIARMMQKE